MSAFLGPIHSIMYQRIITLQKVINSLAKCSQEKGWDADVEDYVIEEFPPIEDVVDLNNIHASLFNMVNGAETRYAETLGYILKDHPERLEQIEEVIKTCGVCLRIEDADSPEEACYKLQETLLDGMPCDRASMTTQNEDGSVEIIRTQDLHSSYFEAAGLDGDLYYQLLKSFVEGLFFQTKFALSGNFLHNIVISE